MRKTHHCSRRRVLLHRSHYDTIFQMSRWLYISCLILHKTQVPSFHLQTSRWPWGGRSTDELEDLEKSRWQVLKLVQHVLSIIVSELRRITRHTAIYTPAGTVGLWMFRKLHFFIIRQSCIFWPKHLPNAALTCAVMSHKSVGEFCLLQKPEMLSVTKMPTWKKQTVGNLQLIWLLRQE